MRQSTSSFQGFWRHAGAVLSIAAVLHAGPAVCDDDYFPAPPVKPIPRPEALTQSAADIKSGKPADAQVRLLKFIKEDPKNSYVPEAEYMLGQALAAQGMFEEGKIHLEKAIDLAPDRTLKALALFGRADCNMALEHHSLASRQYHWLETMYRDVTAIPQDELMYKLGLACKKAGSRDLADYWFNKVIDLYATGPYFELAKKENSNFNPKDPNKKPLEYLLNVDTFATQEKADDAAAKLRDKGYKNVVVVPVSHNSRKWYEVSLGGFKNESDALRAQTDAELAGLSCSLRPRYVEGFK